MVNIYYIFFAVVLILVYCEIIKIRFDGKNNKDIHPNVEKDDNYSPEAERNIKNEEDYYKDLYGDVENLIDKGILSEQNKKTVVDILKNENGLFSIDILQDRNGIITEVKTKNLKQFFENGNLN